MIAARTLVMTLAIALLACSKADGAAGGAALPAGVHIVMEDGPVNVAAWLAMQRKAQLGCFLAKGRRPETVPDKELLSWEQAQRAFTSRVERWYAPDAYVRDETTPAIELDTASCRWQEKPRRKVVIARGCKATEIDFRSKAIRERVVGTPECIAQGDASLARKAADFLDKDGERRTVAGQPCRLQTGYVAGTRACVLEEMPIHPLADDRISIAWEPDPAMVESARKARQEPPSRELTGALGAGLQLPSGRQGQATLVEVGKPIPAQRLAIPAEAREFQR